MSPTKKGRPGATGWRHPGERTELLKAIGAAAGVVVLTALIIFLIKPGSSSTSTEIPQTPVNTTPAGSTVPGGSTDATTPTSTPADPSATSTPTSTPADSTPPTTPSP